MSREIFFLVLVFYCIIDKHLVQACGCQTYTYKPYLERNRFLGKLSDYIKLNDLSVIGTHLSTSCTVKDERLRTQDLTISQQLKYGVRVFEIWVCPHISHFEFYPNPGKSGYSFHDLLFDINKFLDDFPGEFVIIFLHESEICAPTWAKRHCNLISDYIFNVWGGWRMVTTWKLNDIIGIHRNRILLASADPSFANCTFNTKRQCQTRRLRLVYSQKHTYDINTGVVINTYLEFDQNMNEHSNCNIFNTRFNIPNFNRRAIAKDGGFWVKNICGVPVNLQLEKFFKRDCRGIVVVMSDYVTQELIDRINDINFKNSSWRTGWD